MSHNCKNNIERGCAFCDCASGNGCCSDGDGCCNEIGAKSCAGCDKLSSTDWLEGYPTLGNSDIFEVRFKNTRKGFYANVNKLPLKKGDIVAVEASPGHDIGIVSLTGDMVALQMKRSGFRSEGVEFKKIYRLAKPYDIEKWQEAIVLEHQTMIETRKIASSLGLSMKIGDVEYQGDRLKAIFYYIADERVDFRELIRVLADQFKIRIEMKQIGARQEAGRIGGIAACGRELCCSSFISNFVSVTTNSARFQEISLNPQKLAGQCGKLKCCLNYEVDVYIDAKKGFPKITAPLESIDGSFYLVKSDIFKKEMVFSSDPSVMANLTTLPVQRVWEIIKLNRKGIKVDQLNNAPIEDLSVKSPDYENVVGEESITRFDNTRGRKNNNRRKGRKPSDGEKPSQNGGEGENTPQPRRRRFERDGDRKNERGDAKVEGQNRGEERAKGDRPEGREVRNNNRRSGNRQNRPNRDGEQPREGAREQREPREQRDTSESREPRENRSRRPNGRNRNRSANENEKGGEAPKREAQPKAE